MRICRKHKMISLLLAVILLLSQGIAHAESVGESENEPLPSRYQTIAQISAALRITGNTAKCTGRVTLKETYTGTLIVTLQRKDGNSWVYVTSWSGNVPAGGSKKVEGTYPLSIHATYRVKVSFVSGIENETMYSYTQDY